MARTKNVARKSTGGKAPRKSTGGKDPRISTVKDAIFDSIVIPTAQKGLVELSVQQLQQILRVRGYKRLDGSKGQLIYRLDNYSPDGVLLVKSIQERLAGSTSESLSKSTVKQLKEYLRDLGQKVSGKKAILVERILSAIEVTVVQPISVQASTNVNVLPPLSTNTLPPLATSPVNTLPPLVTGTLPPLASSPVNTLPPLATNTLPPLSTSTLPPLVTGTLQPLATSPVNTLPPFEHTNIPPFVNFTLQPLATSPLNTLPPLASSPGTTLPPLVTSPVNTLPPLRRSSIYPSTTTLHNADFDEDGVPFGVPLVTTTLSPVLQTLPPLSSSEYFVTPVIGLTDYDQRSQSELLVLAQNLHGVTLPVDMKKENIIIFLKTKKLPDIIAPGTQVGVLSPVVSTVSGSVLPANDKLPTTVSSGISMPLPPLGKMMSRLSTVKTAPKTTVIKSPTSAVIKLPPMPVINIQSSVPSSVPKETEIQKPQKTDFILTGLPPLSTDQIPPKVPADIKAVISPIPVFSSTSFPPPIVIGDFGDIPKELADISAPTKLKEKVPETITGISMPLLPSVIPSQSVKLPSPTGEISKFPQFPQPVPVPEVYKTYLPEQTKVGPGGLPIQTDLSTLNQLRNEINTTVNINPRASFQRRIPANTLNILPPSNVLPQPANVLPLPIASPLTQQVVQLPLPPLSQVVQPHVQLPLTVSLPTGKVTKTTMAIHIPKIKETVKPADELVKGMEELQITFPTFPTVMNPIPLTSPKEFQQKAELAIAYTPEQQVVQNIQNIDTSKLNPKRVKRGDTTSYTVTELKAIAGSINLSKSGNKKNLVDKIRAAILKINPNATFPSYH